MARCSFFRYPGIRLNQLNWNCALYALDAELTGASDLLRGDYREQMLRFARFATRIEHPGGSTNLGPGWHFHYLPNYDYSAMANLDAPEYASEVLDCVRHYSVALAAGMEPLPEWALALPAHAGWELALPSYGSQASLVVEHAGSSTALEVGASGPALSAVRRILVRAKQGGYIITPVTAPAGARLSAVHPPADTGAARPGPTLLIAGAHTSARPRSVKLALELHVS